MAKQKQLHNYFTNQYLHNKRICKMLYLILVFYLLYPLSNTSMNWIQIKNNQELNGLPIDFNAKLNYLLQPASAWFSIIWLNSHLSWFKKRAAWILSSKSFQFYSYKYETKWKTYLCIYRSIWFCSQSKVLGHCLHFCIQSHPSGCMILSHLNCSGG